MFNFLIYLLPIFILSSCFLDKLDGDDIHKNEKTEKTEKDAAETTSKSTENNAIINQIKKYNLFNQDIRNKLSSQNLISELAKIDKLGPISFTLSKEDKNKQKFIAKLIPLMSNLNHIELSNISQEELYDMREHWFEYRPGDSGSSWTGSINQEASESFHSHVLTKKYDIALIAKIIKLFNSNNPKFLANKLNINYKNFKQELAKIKQLGPIELISPDDHDAEEVVAYAIQFMNNLTTIDISNIRSQKLIHEIFAGTNLWNRNTINYVKLKNADFRGTLVLYIGLFGLEKLDIFTPFNSYTNTSEIKLSEANVKNINNNLKNLNEFIIGPKEPSFINPNIKFLKQLDMNKNLSEAQIINKNFR
jgi:hypothetical protein